MQILSNGLLIVAFVILQDRAAKVLHQDYDSLFESGPPVEVPAKKPKTQANTLKETKVGGSTWYIEPGAKYWKKGSPHEYEVADKSKKENIITVLQTVS